MNHLSLCFLPNTAYSIFVNSLSGSSLALRRAQGLANGTTNDAYDVTNGFTVLDTFRNNGANYMNNPGPPSSHPAFAISFGTTSAVPEPTAIPEPGSAFVTLGILAAGMMIRRRGKKAA